MKTPKTKTPKTKTPKTTKITRTSPARQIAQTSIRRAQDYVLPGSLVLGTGIAAAAGLVFRNQLRAVGRLAAEMAGHQKVRPPVHRVAEAGLGALGGLVAGSALAIWFARSRATGTHDNLRAPLRGGISEKAMAEPRSNSVGRIPSSQV